MNANLEQAQVTALGVAMEHPDKVADIFLACKTDDFDGQYQRIAEAIHGLYLNRVDISTLAVTDEMTRRGTLGIVGGAAEIHRIAQFGFGSAEYACQVIARTAKLRRLWHIGRDVQHDAEALDGDPLAVAKRAVDGAQAVIDYIESEGDINTLTLGEFLDKDDPPYDWVIPGLMERGDRLILTGSEGLGKSVLQRQLAVCAAAGIHPFTHKRVPPVSVLYVDCENGPVKLRRALRPLVQNAMKYGDDPTRRMFIEAIPEGLDLTRAEDEMYLTRMVAGIQPALMLTGPIYRLHAKNPNDEEPARQVARVLDRCRASANCALITEAHAGHGFGHDKRPVRPTGTSLWLRWPEFGYGLRAGDNYNPDDRHVEFVAWRGDREAREWPAALQSGGRWPWSAIEVMPRTERIA